MRQEGEMAFHDYELRADWRVRAEMSEVAALVAETVADVKTLVRYWPEANVDYRVVEPGAASGLGRVIDACTKGFLPYRLRWRLRVVQADYPHVYRFVTRGDFEGAGAWVIDAHEEHVLVHFDWRVRLQKPVVRLLSWALRPLFIANHRWAMAQGERRLNEELDRRRQVARTIHESAPRVRHQRVLTRKATV